MKYCTCSIEDCTCPEHPPDTLNQGKPFEAHTDYGKLVVECEVLREENKTLRRTIELIAQALKHKP